MAGGVSVTPNGTIEFEGGFEVARNLEWRGKATFSDDGWEVAAEAGSPAYEGGVSVNIDADGNLNSAALNLAAGPSGNISITGNIQGQGHARITFDGSYREEEREGVDVVVISTSVGAEVSAGGTFGEYSANVDVPLTFGAEMVYDENLQQLLDVDPILFGNVVDNEALPENPTAVDLLNAPGELGAIAQRAVSNPDGAEAAYIDALIEGDPAAIANSAMRLPGVYDDQILRELAHNGDYDIPPGDSDNTIPPSSGHIDTSSFGLTAPELPNQGGSSGGGVAGSTVGPGTGGTGKSENHSEPSPTGYDGRGVEDLDGAEAGGTFGGSEQEDDRATDGYGGAMMPVVLDLDGDGVEIAFGENTFFDIDGDGYQEQTSWAAADDGFLVIDLDADGSISDGDGQIDQVRELSFALWSEEGVTDLQALAEARDADGNLVFDTNGDSVLDANDAVWDAMKVWQDLDQDGETDEGELKHLSEWGISQINLTYDDGSAFSDTDDDISVFGNTLHGLGSYIKDGEVVEGGVGDVSLAYNAEGWRKVETDAGYAIEFEAGVTLNYVELDGTGSASVSLAERNYSGAFGDERNNNLDASDHIISVQISGADGNDTLTGGVGYDMLSGGEGIDALYGGEGDDMLFFDATDAAVFGGDGFDVAVVEAGSAGISFDIAGHSIEAFYGGEGDDYAFVTVDYHTAISATMGTGYDRATGGMQDDILSGDEGDDSLWGQRGDDVIFGGAGDDHLVGGAGADFVQGGTGADLVSGNEGDDLLSAGSGQDTLWGGHGDDHLQAGSGDDDLYGFDDDDLLFGADGNDSIIGGDGDDQLFGGAGSDTMHGGIGDDIFDGGDGNDIFVHNGEGGYDIVVGGNGFDILRLTGTRSEYEIWSNGQTVWLENHGRQISLDLLGVERIEFGDGTMAGLVEADGGDQTLADYVSRGHTTGLGKLHDHPYLDNWGYGSNSWDAIDGGAGDDTLFGLERNDALFGGTGSDAVVGGTGHDTVVGQTGADGLWGGEGNDRLEGGAGADTMRGDNGADSLWGSHGGDVLLGDDGNDVLYGQNGADLLWGGDGRDTLDGGDGSDMLFGNKGDDSIRGNDGADRIRGGDGDDRIDGGNSDDNASGNVGEDTLLGNYGDDALYGGFGNDSLYGGHGTDLLVGGLQSDVLHGQDGNDYLVGDAQSEFEGGGLSGGMSSMSVDASDATALMYIASYDSLIDELGASASAGRSHFEKHGLGEGREVTFDALAYIASYGDLIKEFGSNAAAGAAHLRCP